MYTRKQTQERGGDKYTFKGKGQLQFKRRTRTLRVGDKTSHKQV